MKTSERVLNYVETFIRQHDYAPSMREIADGVGLKSASTVKGHLDRLREQGVVDFEADRPRTLRIVS